MISDGVAASAVVDRIAMQIVVCEEIEGLCFGNQRRWVRLLRLLVGLGCDEILVRKVQRLWGRL